MEEIVKKLPPSVRRWMDIALLCVAGLFPMMLLLPYLDRLLKLYKKLPYYDWPDYSVFVISIVFIAILWIFIIRLGGFRVKDITSMRFFYYPPIWFFGIISGFVYLYICHKYLAINNESSYEYTLIPLVLLFGIVLAVVINTFLNNYDKDIKVINKNSEDEVEGNNTEEDIFDWIENETPIKSAVQDRYGFNEVSQRIVEILYEFKIKSIGVIGPYGIGKTSLLNLVENQINEINSLAMSNKKNFNGSFLICKVDGWGRNKGSIAQQILQIAVKKTCEEIDCLSVITVPAHYKESISSAKGPVSSIISTLLRNNREPMETLMRLNFILNASRIRMIIFLEDLDRNIDDDVIRNEVPALLDRIHNLTNISFILAIGTELDYSEMIIKLCEHQEYLV